MRRSEEELTVIGRKGQLVIPQALRKKLGIVPRTRFLVYGEGDTVMLRRVELPDAQEDWKNLKAVVRKRLVKYGQLSEEEIETTVRKYRHKKSQRS